jgi:hypothetical protein
MSPIDYKKYAPDWKEISKLIIEKAGFRCELCDAAQGSPHWKTGSRVVLTTHHIDGNPKNNAHLNLIALCQRCHLKLDLPLKWARRRAKKGQTMPDLDGMDPDSADAIQTLISGAKPMTSHQANEEGP